MCAVRHGVSHIKSKHKSLILYYNRDEGVELTNEQLNRIEPIILSLTPVKDNQDRKAPDPREVMNFYLLRYL